MERMFQKILIKGSLRDIIFIFVSKRDSAHKQELHWFTSEIVEFIHLYISTKMTTLPHISGH